MAVHADRTAAPAAKRVAPARATGPAPSAPAQFRAAAGVLDRAEQSLAERSGPEFEAPNRTGLPDRLKAGVETLSGLAMDDVRVHRNSPEPAKLGALAYTKGSEIHVGPGQEQHLPHEAWHVVQQKQGRVAPTASVQPSQPALKLSAPLESEADAMGSALERLPHPPACSDKRPEPAVSKPVSGYGRSIQPKLSILSSKVTYTSYTPDLDLIVKSITKYYNYTANTLIQWFSDDRLRVYWGVSNAVKEIESLYAPSVTTLSSEAMDYKSSNRGLPDEETKTKVVVLRSAEFKMGLADVVRPYLRDYEDGAESVKSNLKSRVYAHAVELVGAGNCDEISEVVYWKLMSSTKSKWVATAHLQPFPPYDHKFVLLSNYEIPTGSKSPIPADALVVDEWWNENIVPFTAYLTTKNHYHAMLSRENVDVEKGSETIGYDILDEEIAAAVEASIGQLVDSLSFKIKLLAPKGPR